MITTEELDSLDRLAKDADMGSVDLWFDPFADELVIDGTADIAFIGAMDPTTAQRLTATIREQAAEIERLRQTIEDHVLCAGRGASGRIIIDARDEAEIRAAIAAQGGGAE